MKERILCYGDSNTYGYDASVYFGGRFPEAQTWVGRLNSDPDLADFQFILWSICRKPCSASRRCV